MCVQHTVYLLGMYKICAFVLGAISSISFSDLNNMKCVWICFKVILNSLIFVVSVEWGALSESFLPSRILSFFFISEGIYHVYLLILYFRLQFLYNFPSISPRFLDWIGHNSIGVNVTWIFWDVLMNTEYSKLNMNFNKEWHSFVFFCSPYMDTTAVHTIQVQRKEIDTFIDMKINTNNENNHEPKRSS